ncbi:MAG: hypothetical protein H7Y13_02355 [Sphingobacteriaceae bacterium]|nr:hypothetical protein [Sphingobacteriaceae bacterium]
MKNLKKEIILWAADKVITFFIERIKGFSDLQLAEMKLFICLEQMRRKR